jgi:L-ascorbate metabolism protein UlaG (beta-lactamase superfamily)
VKITYYRQNAFVIEAAGKRILIDPGRSLGCFRPLIPKREWEGADIILVTHRDPDHFAFVPKIASRHPCEVVCENGLGPLVEKKGIERVHFLSVGETIELQGVEIVGLPALHGPGRAKPLGEEEENRKGSIGFSFRVEGKSVVNLGDTVFLDAWKGLEADVLMVPIGGFFTMNRKEALRAVRLIKPRMVIPTHFHWKLGPYVHPARVKKFAGDVAEEGIKCVVLGRGESVEV